MLVCSIPDCNDRHEARGWCQKHYRRWHRHGDPLRGGLSIVERFWAKVDRSGGPDACWPWTAYRFPKGYGGFMRRGQHQLAHRIAYELDRGHPPPPERPMVLHHCDNPPCCRPSHLFSGTQADKWANARMKGRRPVAKQRERR